MAITRKPSTPSSAQSAEAFIAGAPDGTAPVPGIRRGNKQQISLTIAPELLLHIDKMAEAMGQSRAGLINMAVYTLVKEWRAKNPESET